MQKDFTLCKIFFLASALLFIYNCKNNFDIPFPSDESEFAQPVSRPFQFSETQKINWIAPNSDSINPPSVEKFDVNTLLSRPFSMEEFKPLENPMTETKFDWNSLPESTFSLNGLPTKPLKFETKILGIPKIVKAELPEIKEGTSSGVLQFGVDQGLPYFEVWCILKDNKNLVWIGTSYGLCRFDGENLEIYSTDQGLSDDGIRSLFKDKQGRIWAGHWGGVVELLDLKNGTIQKINYRYRSSLFGYYKVP